LRLGREKALEKIDEQSLIERTLGCLSPVSQRVLVVTSQAQFGLIAARVKGKIIVDLCPGKGVLGGLYTGLANSGTFYNLVVGCDMPFLNRDLLRYLIGLAPNFDVVIPKIDGMTEPLHAVYSKKCLASIEQLLHEGKLAISQLFSLVRTRYVGEAEITKFDSKHLSFFNINSQDDLRKAKMLMKQGASSSSW